MAENSPQKNSWVHTRQTRYGAYAFVYTVVILAVVIVGNWLANSHNKTVDVTSNKQYTLSDQTKKVVGNLKKDINVYYFDQSSGYDRARDMLDRYANLSPHLKVSYVDPDKKPDIARVEGARQMGDVIVDSGTKKETAKALTEEELTGAIIRAIKNGVRTTCFVKGEGEHSLDDTGRDGYSTLKSALETNNYKTESISLLEKPQVPSECSIVVVGGPKHDFLPPAVDALKTYVKNGGSLLVALDPVLNLPPPDGKLGDTPNLVSMVSDWGVAVKGDVVLDMSAASQMFGQLSPIVGSYTQQPIVRVMQDNASVMPLARSMEVKTPAEALFSSTADSYALTDPKLPIKQDDITKGTKGPFVLGAAATIGSGDKAGRVVVVGSSDWMSNFIMAAPIANRDLALNMANWLTQDTDLISIRPKDPEDRRLHITTAGVRTLFFTSIIGIPLIVILSGVSVWWKRR
ncbi:MAG TPA: GldG family protein [Bryobacteraceae bacterium]|nr:GldG family protein [Bryobacteraceae bacterium]